MFTSSPGNVQTGLPPGADSKIKKRPKWVVIYFGSPNQIVIPTMPGGMAGPFRLVRFKHAMRVFTNFAHELYQFKSGGRRQNKKTTQTGRCLFWQPQPDSNWCSRLERAVSWASRRWGQNCAVKPFNFTWAAVIPAPGPAKIYFRGWFWRERWGRNCH